MNIIKVINVWKKFNNKYVLKNINFVLRKGTIHGLIGPNGAGKTTIIKCIMKGIKLDKGEIYFNDKKIEEKFMINQEISFMHEEIRFSKDLTVKEFIELVAQLRNIEKRKMKERLEESDLKQHSYKKCNQLSTGWKKILFYFLAVIDDSSVIVLDEPTSGLDPSYRHILLDQLKEAKERGKTILLSTHILSDLDKLADDITLINEGEIIYSGSKSFNAEEMYEKLILKKEFSIKAKKAWI